MKSMLFTGILLAIILAYQGITYTTHEKII